MWKCGSVYEAGGSGRDEFKITFPFFKECSLKKIQIEKRNLDRVMIMEEECKML